MGLESLGARPTRGDRDRTLAGRTDSSIENNPAIEMGKAPDIAKILQDKSNEGPFFNIVNDTIARRGATSYPDSAMDGAVLYMKIRDGVVLTPEDRAVLDETRAAFWSRSEAARLASANLTDDNISRIVELTSETGDGILAEAVGQVGKKRAADLMKSALRRKSLQDPDGFAALADTLRQTQQLRSGKEYKRLDKSISDIAQKYGARRNIIERLLADPDYKSAPIHERIARFRQETGGKLGLFRSAWAAGQVNAMKNSLIRSRDLRAIDENLRLTLTVITPTLESDEDFKRALAEDMRRALRGEPPLATEPIPEPLSQKVQGTESQLSPVADIVRDWRAFVGRGGAGERLGAFDRINEWNRSVSEMRRRESARWGTGLLARIAELLFGRRFSEARDNVKDTFV